MSYEIKLSITPACVLCGTELTSTFINNGLNPVNFRVFVFACGNCYVHKNQIARNAEIEAQEQDKLVF